MKNGKWMVNEDYCHQLILNKLEKTDIVIWLHETKQAY